MAYKDKDKQREANRERQRRYRRDKQGVTKGVTVIPKPDIMRPLTDKDVAAMPLVTIVNRPFKDLPNTDTLGTEAESLQHKSGSDTMSVKTVKFPTHKRGKDIKVFADLPAHVQQSIEQMSLVDGRVNQTIKANRTAIAINYQHQFPDRYHSTGV